MALVTAQVSLSIAANLAGVLNVGSSAASLSSVYSTALGASLSAGAGLADVGWWDLRTLTASSSETLDFAGTLTDPFGVTVSFARIKVLIIAAAGANANNVVIGGGATTMTGLFGATTHTLPVRPGGTAMWLTGTADSTGYAVTAGTADLLAVANSGSGTPVTYAVAAIGVST